jgi:nitrite reductase/ring-hydroxylating ferredoxin subunit
MKHRLANLDDIPGTGTLLVPFFGREIHLWRKGERYRAAANACPHMGGPLECKGGELVCPWHGARFSLDTLRRTEGSRLMVLPTRVEDGALYYTWGE